MTPDKKEIRCYNCGFYLRFFKDFIGTIECPMCCRDTSVIDGLSDISKKALSKKEGTL